MMTMNPWLDIPLVDYEEHMAHSAVGQHQLLSSLTKKYLQSTKPLSCIFLGVAGGNGLEHVDPSITKKVIGIDINALYLEAANTRHSSSIGCLELLQLDITTDTDTIERSEFIWVALIAEYTGVDRCLEFVKNNLVPTGHAVISIQSNNNAQSVSASGIDSVKKLGPIFSEVNPSELLLKATQAQLTLVGQEENFLPNGKSIKTFHFRSAE